ncbi:MAG TPA: chemotaxis protein CheB [Candidatus Polarisedimenticolia bacterium]|nr:chemotaxis protein CheB [Candidatus Polarisedimenticolia bacterium]
MPKGSTRKKRRPAGAKPAPPRAKRNPARDSLVVVGVGASAGGLEAFTQLLEGLPDDTGMAFVLVQHLAPKHDSALVSLLGPATGMRVEEVHEGTRIQANHVYVIPPNSQMEVDGGRLHLKPRPAGPAQHNPIDHFFRSLAEALGNRAIGVVLSGTASDGALGLREIKAAGGIAIAQDPSTAAYGGMPHAAVATGVVDLVLPVKEIARYLMEFPDHPYAAPPPSSKEEEEEEEKRRAAGMAANDAQLQKIFTMLRNAKGVDFSLYKPPTIQRRIQRRMALHKLQEIDRYVGYLKDTPAEVDALYHDILIQVTHFFREPEVLNSVVKEVFPRLLRGRPADTALRIWIPGCATGEEVYSVAILLLETLEPDAPALPIQIFGTDVSEAAVDYARNGVYPEAIREHVSPERLRKFFTHADGTYRITKKVRELCVFARQDLSRDPPFSRLDLVVCRNVLIYLGAPLQKRLMNVFHYAIKPTGFLVLGKAETVGLASDIFTPLDKKQRIYVRRAQEMSPTSLFTSDLERHRIAPGGRKPTLPERHEQSVIGQANQYLLEHYTPPGVLVDANLHILQFRGQTGAYLEPAPGSASLNLLKMAREGLIYGLRTALHTARKRGQPVSKEGLRVRSDGGYRTVDLEVTPIGGGGRDMHFLIVFHDADASDRKVQARSVAAPHRRTAREEREDGRVARLQQELAASRDYLQSMIQDLEAANEELQSANEEVLSSNEELQSTNEELDTAKEELQSINEELNTVNEELHARNDELSRVNSDLINLLGNVQIAIVMINSELRVRRFTPMAERMFNLIPGDLGRPIGNISPAFEGPSLQDLITEVVDTVNSRSVDVRDRDGHWFTLTVRPYKNAANRIDGAVMVLYDIDAVRREESRTRFHRELAKSALNLAPEPVLIVDADLRVKGLNRAYARRFELSDDEAAGLPIAELPGGLWKTEEVTAALLGLLEQAEGSAELPIPADGGVGRTTRVTARRIAGEDGRGAIVLVLADGDGGGSGNGRKRAAEGRRVPAR